jgi:hypothetical protein
VVASDWEGEVTASGGRDEDRLNDSSRQDDLLRL